jgi:hypothetical protein
VADVVPIQPIKSDCPDRDKRGLDQQPSAPVRVIYTPALPVNLMFHPTFQPGPRGTFRLGPASEIVALFPLERPGAFVDEPVEEIMAGSVNPDVALATAGQPWFRPGIINAPMPAVKGAMGGPVLNKM